MAFTTSGPELVTNGSFEDLTSTVVRSYGFAGLGLLTGWVDAGGEDLDLHSDARGGLAATDGSLWLDTDGASGNIDISQSVSGVEADAVYPLSLDLGQSPELAAGDNGLEVYWGGVLVGSIPAGSFGLQTLNFTLLGGAGDGSNTLRFVGTGTADGVGASLDNVSLSLVGDVVDDNVTLSESEASGDVDLNALANDTIGNAVVVAVNGSTGNVDASVAGSNGGSFTVSADGSVDFDAGTDFESLGVGESAVTTVTYTLNSPEPFAAGSQSVVSSGGVGPADQEAFFTFNAGEFTNDGTTDISGSINLSGITQPTYNILFVMDVSGSASGGNFPGVGDLNGDGISNSIIDAVASSPRNSRGAGMISIMMPKTMRIHSSSGMLRNISI